MDLNLEQVKMFLTAMIGIYGFLILAAVVNLSIHSWKYGRDRRRSLRKTETEKRIGRERI